MDKKSHALVIFGKNFPRVLERGRRYHVVVAPKKLEQEVKARGFQWVELEGLIGPGSIYEASAFAKELSSLKLGDGTRLVKSFIYKGYELWWMYYNSLFLYFCFPYTQYKNLLEYLKNFQNVSFYQPPYKSLFSHYLQAYSCKISLILESGFRSPRSIPLGVLLQILITLICLPVLMVKKRHMMIFIGDKFEKNQDYDFRMKFIYRELRQRDIPFVEFVRSLESWKKVLQHVWVRKRPVIYSEAVVFAGKFLGGISGSHRRARRELNTRDVTQKEKPEARFKFLVATQHLLGVYDDIWAIRIMKFILSATRVKTAFITATLERNFHTFLGCKLNMIPTVGILHGVASQYFNGYDFLPSFDGVKMLSVDKYGLWSEWWKQYYIKYSQAYKQDQLYVSGPMRSLENKSVSNYPSRGLQKNASIKVLFVPGQLSEPQETMPYLLTLMESRDISVYLTFRPYRDAFEKWLKENNPKILKKIGKEKILLGDIHEAINQCEVVVGCYSTAALEALLFLKPLVFFQTNKWGDYFELKDYGKERDFFADSPDDLIKKIKKAQGVSTETLKDLQERYFGDPYKNGAKWVVDQLEGALLKGRITK